MYPVKEANKLDMAFGPEKISDWIPRYDEIPDEFRRGHTKWNKLFSEMFFCGLRKLNLVPNDGVDADKAWAHLRTISGSFEPKHEHKEAAFAYLASQWFKDSTTWEKA
jgi:hypothetical protein